MQIYTDDQSLEIYFQGLIMDLITDLSRFRSLEIIAYNTAKALQPDEEADSASIENLKLDYMVKGIARATKGQVNFNL